MGLLLLQNMSDPCTTAGMVWIYCQTTSVVESAVPLLGGNANLYSEYSFLCIRLNSSKIHSSNNNIAACTAPFVLPHTLQLMVQCTYRHPQPCIQHALSFEYFTCCILSMHAPLAVLEPSGSRIQLKDHKDLLDLPLIPLFIVFFNKILDLSKLQNNFKLFLLL